MARKTSKRKAIRKAIIKTLYGNTDAGDNVTANRSETNWQENLPAINVYMRGEECEDKNQAPRQLMREISFEVEIIADGRDGEELSDVLDDLAEQVEVCLSIDDTLDCTADDIVLTSISDMEAVSDGSKPTGSIRLMYIVRYHEFSPRSIRDQGTFRDFEKAGAQWQVGHDDGPPDMAEADRAKDEFSTGS